MTQEAFLAAINQICDEKNIPKEIVIETVEHALAAAYRKDYGHRDQTVRVHLDQKTGVTQVFVIKEVVKEEVENDMLQISLKDAKKIKKDVKVEETVEIEDHPKDFGRIAAQTAKQVIIQRIREAERDIVFEEYKDKEGDLVNAVVQRIEGSTVILDLGRASGVLFANEQVPGERYYIGQRLKVYIVKVEQSNKGPQVIISRSHPGVVKSLFELEVPEIEAGIVEVKSIAREAGHRTKIAVTSNEENVDPVGSCVGQRGIRVQAVMAELGEEKIDIILWDEDSVAFITNALSPAKVIEIKLDEKDKKATVKVPEDQLSLAIGKQGQNVRLAAKLTGWNVDIEGADDSGVQATEKAAGGKRKDLEGDILKAVEQNAEKEKPEKAKEEKKDKEVKKEELKEVENPVEEALKKEVEEPKAEEKKESNSVEASTDKEKAEKVEKPKTKEKTEEKKDEPAKKEKEEKKDSKEVKKETDEELAEEILGDEAEKEETK